MVSNRPPNVFVSSTMYDLIDLRSQLRRFVEGLGWRAVMSEHDSFPIDPDQTTVENSRRNVRENADIFVMVVGARYGSIDAAADKSVTNLEFVEARSRGVPVYVFVSRDVLAQLRVWKANPEADYSSVVDTPRIFEFIDSFRGGGEVWTFEFRVAEDIVGSLRQQFAYLVQGALELRQMARGQDYLLATLDGTALMVALQRDEFWELRLFGTVLQEELDRRVMLRHEIKYGLAGGEAKYVDIAELGQWVQDRAHEITELVQTAATIVNDYLPRVLDEDGVSADPIELADVARRLAQTWEDSARWTLRCRAVRVDDRAVHLVDLVSRANANMLDELWEWGHEIIARLDTALAALAAGDAAHLDLTCTLTADVDELLAEFNRLATELSADW